MTIKFVIKKPTYFLTLLERVAQTSIKLNSHLKCIFNFRCISSNFKCQLSFNGDLNLIEVCVTQSWHWKSIFLKPSDDFPWFFVAHLAFRPCELLSSLFVRRPSVNISHFNLLLRNHWANCNQPLVEWSLGGPLPKLCLVIPTSNQGGCQAKNRKKRGWNLKKIFSSETTEPISTKLCWNDPWMVPFQNCVRHFRPPTKMATTAELNLT